MRLSLVMCVGCLVGLAAANQARATSYLELMYYGPGATRTAYVWRNGVLEGNVYTGVYNLQLNSDATSYSGPEAANLVGQAQPPGYWVGAFCMDVLQDAPTGDFHLYEIYDLKDAPVGGGNTAMEAARADALRRLFGGYWMNPFYDADKAAAFEAAVWEIIYETDGAYNVYSGGLRIEETSGGYYWGATANTWLSSLASQPVNDEVVALVNGDWQDYALTIPGFGGLEEVPVIPEPLTVLGLLAGVGGVGAYLRRRRRA